MIPKLRKALPSGVTSHQRFAFSVRKNPVASNRFSFQPPNRSNSSLPAAPSAAQRQAAAVEALTGSQEFLEDWRHKYQHRRDLALSILQGAPGIKAHCPQGAFYIFADCQALLGQSDGNRRFLSGDDIAAYLLDECNVVVVPGSAFGASDYFRMSFATSEQNINKGCAAIVSAFGSTHAR